MITKVAKRMTAAASKDVPLVEDFLRVEEITEVSEARDRLMQIRTDATAVDREIASLHSTMNERRKSPALCEAEAIAAGETYTPDGSEQMRLSELHQRQGVLRHAARIAQRRYEELASRASLDNLDTIKQAIKPTLVEIADAAVICRQAAHKLQSQLDTLEAAGYRIGMLQVPSLPVDVRRGDGKEYDSTNKSRTATPDALELFIDACCRWS